MQVMAQEKEEVELPPLDPYFDEYDEEEHDATADYCNCVKCEEDYTLFLAAIEQRLEQKQDEPFYDENHPDACMRCGMVTPNCATCSRCGTNTDGTHSVDDGHIFRNASD